METVSFGRTGLKVSRLCLGTMTLGSSKWKPWALDEIGMRGRSSSGRSISASRFFDMANWYSIGEGERVVASTLTSMVPRDRLVLATKAKYPMSDDPNDQGLSRKHLLSSVDASLRRMGTDYVDIFMVHAFDPVYADRRDDGRPSTTSSDPARHATWAPRPCLRGSSPNESRGPGKRLDAFREYAMPVQPALPGRGAGNASLLS